MDGGSYCVHGDSVTGIDIGIDIGGIGIGTGGLTERLCVLEGIGGEARESESEATILVGGGLAPGPGADRWEEPLAVQTPDGMYMSDQPASRQALAN